MKKKYQPLKKSFHSSDLRNIVPKTINQNIAIKSFLAGDNLALLGCAGTGKTFLALYLGLRSVLAGEHSKVILVRSAVPVRDLGHLPGTYDEKTSIYELPYKPMCDELFPFSRCYENLKLSGYIDFFTTSYVRGVTFYDSVVIVDEAQSLNAHELDSIITRLGTSCRLVICGDSIQSDLRYSERYGFNTIIPILADTPHFTCINFTADDIVRSGFVRDYIISRDKHGLIV